MISGELIKDIKKLSLPINKEDISFSFICGSYVEENCNAESDIDYCVVCKDFSYEFINYKKQKDELFINKGTHFLHWFRYQGKKYDIEYYKEDDIIDYIQKLNELRIDNELFIEPIQEDVFAFLHRLKESIPLLEAETYQKILERAEFYKLNIQLAVLKRHKYKSLMEDAAGALGSKDYGSVYVMVNEAFKMILGAYLACFNETNPNDKWLYRKIKNYEAKTKDNNLLNIYKKVTSIPFDDEESMVETFQSVRKIGDNLEQTVTIWLNSFI